MRILNTKPINIYQLWQSYNELLNYSNKSQKEADQTWCNAVIREIAKDNKRTEKRMYEEIKKYC